LLANLGVTSGYRDARCARYSSPIPETPAEMSNASIVRSGGHDYANAPHPIDLLRPRRERPGDRRAAERR
jgi:hypothetical protein